MSERGGGRGGKGPGKRGPGQRGPGKGGSGKRGPSTRGPGDERSGEGTPGGGRREAGGSGGSGRKSRDDRKGRPGGDRKGRGARDARRDRRAGRNDTPPRPPEPRERAPEHAPSEARERPVPPPPPPSPADALADELEVTVEKLVSGGEGLARHDGVAIFVPRSAPGDRLRIALTERRRDFARGEIVEILAPGPGRREPPCPFFERCGGCDLQHMEDGLQVRAKARAVVETLARLGGIDPPDDLDVVAGDAWGYRLRTQLHTEPAARVGTEPGQVPPAAPFLAGKPAVGYYRRGSRELVAVDRCPILVPELEEILPSLPKVLEEAGERPPRRLDLATGDGDDLTTAPRVAGLPGGEVSVEVAGLTYGYDARSFFQGHRGLLGSLVELVVGPDDPSFRGQHAVDLYAGVGLFALPLARRYDKVTAVESDRIAARYAQANARTNEIGNLVVENRGVEGWISQLDEPVDRVVVDPPRAGLGAEVVSGLVRARPPRLTYVSCHPATLARDLKRLSSFYRLERLSLVDLFPQTGHMEAVAQLVVVEEG